ncbi:putative small integral membrane protein 20-like isoform 2 [Scophthalmus maximus]|uniref:Putative small integral membrane protein 20-like isoform 2 n=1 Tax=Scophthalmus maximus TaxID=52904 RepID=A0A2U9B0Q1_SCOMX|nr:putative small integral membrane protein 20-like isoform 2 [Scophthalmus maximus]
MSKNTRMALVFGGFVAAVGAAFYPIFFYPLSHKDEYSPTDEPGRNQPGRDPTCGCEDLV